MSDPHVEYAKRLQTYVEIRASQNRLHTRVGNSKLAVVIVGLVLAWLSLDKDLLRSYWLLVPISIYAVLTIYHERVLRVRTRAEIAGIFYRKGIARIEDRWVGTGQPGDRFRDGKHVYAEDLDLFGRGCLFELLSTARLPMGENWLANWLRFPSPKATILERQNLIVELREKLDLHLDLAVTGEELRARLNPEALTGWAEGKPVMPVGAWRGVVAMLAIAAAAALSYYFLTSVYWPFLLVLILETTVIRQLRRRAQAVIEEISCNAEGLELFSQMLRRLEGEAFVSSRLHGFAAELGRNGVPASHLIRKLAHIVYWIDARDSLLAKAAELPFLYTVQVGFAAEAWRRRWGTRMGAWVNIAGEMEALISLATYSFEHPNDPFPEFIDSETSQAFIDGQELGHPLIPASTCVRNSVRLDKNTRVLLVSGSNMSGKSSLLRVVGINAVLAMAGAPIRGQSLRLTPLTIGTRIRSTDSLQEGRSTFYTEILHIRQIFDLAREADPLLFLFDELLDGTNSKDRRIGAERLIRALLERRANGIVTTHDLALTEITAALGNCMRNMHFGDQIVDGKMKFDYKLREGVVTKSNAIELMRLIGLEI